MYAIRSYYGTSDIGRKQEGITFLLLTMNTPGIEVQPIISLAGDHELNQVFFNDVRVPVGGRVGDEGDGWRVAKSLMQYARATNVNTGWVRESLVRVKRLAARQPDGYGRITSYNVCYTKLLRQT